MNEPTWPAPHSPTVGYGQCTAAGLIRHKAMQEMAAYAALHSSDLTSSPLAALAIPALAPWAVMSLAVDRQTQTVTVLCFGCRLLAASQQWEPMIVVVGRAVAVAVVEPLRSRWLEVARAAAGVALAHWQARPSHTLH